MQSALRKCLLGRKHCVLTAVQATHGVPAARNSHPQASDPTNEFLVVHNGIITNYAVLRAMLLRHGVGFTSETDTEVPTLCDSAVRAVFRAARSELVLSL